MFDASSKIGWSIWLNLHLLDRISDSIQWTLLNVKGFILWQWCQMSVTNFIKWLLAIRTPVSILIIIQAESLHCTTTTNRKMPASWAKFNLKIIDIFHTGPIIVGGNNTLTNLRKNSLMQPPHYLHRHKNKGSCYYTIFIRQVSEYTHECIIFFW